MGVRKNSGACLRLGATLAIVACIVSSCAVFTTSSKKTVPFQVVISEINYHDALDDANDFVEIQNTGTTKVALTGWCVRGVDFCFENKTVLMGGEFVVVRGSEFGGTLSNSGETLELVDTQDNVRDTVTYGSDTPWATTADGGGYSLHRTVGAAAATNSQDWEAAEPTPGEKWTPRAMMSPRIGVTVVINEVNYHPVNDDPTQEFIELLNTTSSPVNIEGWCIPDVGYCVTSLLVPAGGAVSLAPRVSLDTVSNGGQILRLVNKAGALVDVVPFDDKGEWPALADGQGQSLQRRDPMLSGVEPGNWVSAIPSPGAVNAGAGRGFLPSFHDVVNTRSPEPTQAIGVTASLRDAKAASLVYRVGFGDEVTISMAQSSSGLWSAEIPAQEAGSLVRYRLVATSPSGTGTWPRQGDGATYEGTVVKRAPGSALPELMWFIPDAQYRRAYNDITEYGDDGYTCVFAFDGVVMDNTRIRVKGQQSRLNQKRKWKVVLPAGHEWDMSGVLRNPVNEFSLHSAVTDKSFVREILTSDLQTLSGGTAQQVFPLRLTKNNEFYGLYLYVEQPDGVWRRKYGFSRETVVFKAERQATLRPEHLSLARDEFNLRYQQKTVLYRDAHGTLRSLIRALNDPNEKNLIAFSYQHLDIPQIVEAIATMRVAQHLEWEHKNHQLFYDPTDEKWRLVPVDFDLNFGRRVEPGCNSLCEGVSASAYPEYFSANRLGRVFFGVSQFREMLDRRTKTLADAFYSGARIEKRVAQLADDMEADARLDRRRWFTYGIQQTMRQGQTTLIRDFIVPKRAMLSGSEPAYLPPPQRQKVSFTASGTGPVVVTNTDTVAIDVSGLSVQGISGKIPSGTVLLPKQSVVLSNDRVKAPAFDGRLHVWVPTDWPTSSG